MPFRVYYSNGQIALPNPLPFNVIPQTNRGQPVPERPAWYPQDLSRDDRYSPVRAIPPNQWSGGAVGAGEDGVCSAKFGGCSAVAIGQCNPANLGVGFVRYFFQHVHGDGIRHYSNEIRACITDAPNAAVVVASDGPETGRVLAEIVCELLNNPQIPPVNVLVYVAADGAVETFGMNFRAMSFGQFSQAATPYVL
jgi:hypothetical protein